MTTAARFYGGGVSEAPVGSSANRLSPASVVPSSRYVALRTRYWWIPTTHNLGRASAGLVSAALAINWPPQDIAGIHTYGICHHLPWVQIKAVLYDHLACIRNWQILTNFWQASSQQPDQVVVDRASASSTARKFANRRSPALFTAKHSLPPVVSSQGPEGVGI